MLNLVDLPIKYKLIVLYVLSCLIPMIVIAVLYNYGISRPYFYIMLALIAIAALFISLKIAKEIYFPLSRASAHLDLLAKGDFSIPVSHHGTSRKDDIGNVAKAMDKINKQVGSILQKIKRMTDNHAIHLKTMTNSINQITDGAMTQSANSEELSSAIQTIAANQRDANITAQQSTELAKEAGKIVSENIDAMSKIEGRFDKISAAIGIISDISRQTNLLSINAAVEAARAGESGKGFAVVADEVNQLAQKSSVAAKEITQILDDSLRQVKYGVDMSIKAGEAVNRILTEIDKIAAKLNDISIAVQEQSSASENNSSISESNAAASQEVASTMQEISEETMVIKKLSSRFKVMGE